MEEMNTNQEPVIEQRPSQKYGRTAYQQEMQQEQAWTPYNEQAKAAPNIKNLYVGILMGLVALGGVVAYIVMGMVIDTYTYAESIEDIYSLVEELVYTPAFNTISIVSDVVFWATIAFFVLDIMQLHRAGCKILGAILFAIFLRPAYFIWRAHLLKQKKIIPIIFAVCFYLLEIVAVGTVFAAAFELAMRISV